MNNNLYTGPGVQLQPTQANYMSRYDFSNKFYPELMPQVVPLYNNGITGFCETFGREKGISADTIYWAEGGRRLKVERNVSLVVATGVFTCSEDTVQRVNAQILVADAAGKKLQFGLVTAVNGKTFTAKPYDDAAWTVGTSGLNVITAGSEFRKGTEGMARSLYNQQSIYNTSVTISKDTYSMSGSDICNVTWLYAPDGTPFWYNSDTEEALARFKDLEELKCLLSIKISENSSLKAEGYNSTDGLFSSIRKRGNSFAGVPKTMADWRSLVKRMDKVSGERYNSIFCDTDTSLAIDDMIATANKDMMTPGWGIFDNKERAVDFGFDAFRMGGYEFYKQTWKVLNDPTALAAENLGDANAIHGIMMPMGSIAAQTGYTDQLTNGEPERIDYLTYLYKEKPGYSRKLQTTFYGAASGNGRDDIMGIDWLSERGLLLAGAVKWFIFEGESA